MQIIELNSETCGQERLFSPETWPETTREERHELANQVVDAFHRAAAEAELRAQWIPRSATVKLEEGEVSAETLEAMIEAAYASVSGS